jgi:hypothetical protein
MAAYNVDDGGGPDGPLAGTPDTGIPSEDW